MALTTYKMGLLALLIFNACMCGFRVTRAQYCTAGDKHFMGGSLSFKFIDTSSPEVYKVRLTSVTGWKIGQGPCGQICTIKDIGFSTTLNRRHILNLKGETYFGNWTEKIRRGSTYYYPIINSIVSESWTGEVAAVNENMGWEQEFAEIDLNIDPKSENTDIWYNGCQWMSFNYSSKSFPMKFRNAVQILPEKRNDTGQPNNSPVAMFKPVYRLPLNSNFTIKLSTIDVDGDYVSCDAARFLEAAGLNSLQQTTISKDCTVTVNTDQDAGFVDGGWGAIPIKISDYIWTPMQLENGPIREQKQPISSISMQMMIQTLKTIEAPEFVEPTKESQFEFYVYVGSQLKISLYAKPSGGSTRIDYFHVRTIPRRNFVMSDLHTDPTRRSLGVEYAHATWRPEEKDVGMYVLGALVTDTSGSDGHDRNYKLVVKDIYFIKQDILPQEGPYFPYFPNTTGIECMKGSECIFPIYVKNVDPSDTKPSIFVTKSPFHVTHVQTPVPVKKNGEDMFVADVSFTATVGGVLTFCFHASVNGINSETKCVDVKIVLPDPCWNFPCSHNTQRCLSNGLNFTCDCYQGFTGQLCETGIDYCTSDTCSAGSTCISYPYVSGYAICKCAPGFAGSRCENYIPTCKPDSCNHHGACLDKLNNYTCQCYKGYTGQRCETVDPLCRSHKCDNHGICTVENSVVTCICPLGFTGDHCQEQVLTTNNTEQVQFIVPTPVSGTEIQCELGQPCQIPLFISWANQGKLPRFPIFLKSSEIYGSLSALTPDSYVGLRNSLKFVLTVIPSTPGSGDVCVMTGEGIQSDSVCYRIHTRPRKDIHVEISSSTKLPPMVSPTLPDNSSVTCIKDQPCHIVFASEVDPKSKECLVSSLSSSAIVFPMDSNGNQCRSDILFLPQTQGDSNVCFRAGNCKELCSHYQGEQRCFNVNTSAKDFCRPNPCSKGSCILQPGNTSGFQCI